MTPPTQPRQDLGLTTDAALLRVLEQVRDIARQGEQAITAGAARTGVHALRKVQTRAADAIRHYHEDRAA